MAVQYKWYLIVEDTLHPKTDVVEYENKVIHLVAQLPALAAAPLGFKIAWQSTTGSVILPAGTPVFVHEFELNGGATMPAAGGPSVVTGYRYYKKADVFNHSAAAPVTTIIREIRRDMVSKTEWRLEARK